MSILLICSVKLLNNFFMQNKFLLLMTMLALAAYCSFVSAQDLSDKRELGIFESMTLTSPVTDGVDSLKWRLPKGFILQGRRTDNPVTASSTYYAQSGNVELELWMTGGEKNMLTSAVVVNRPIQEINNITINEGESVRINGIDRTAADIYYEEKEDKSIIAHRLTVMPVENARVLKPYIQTVTSDAIYVTWKASLQEEATVYYGLNGGNLSSSVVASCTKFADNYYWYSAKLEGLSASTVYHYQVSSPLAYSGTNGQSEIYKFKTAPASGSKTRSRVLLMGDHQIKTRSGYEWLMQAAKRKIEEKFNTSIEEAIDVILNVGDQVDLGTLKQYEEIHFYKSQLFSPYVATMTAVGNHETYSDAGMVNYSNHFHYENLEYRGIKSNTENYYAYQLGRTLYIYLSTEHTGSVQKNWVKEVVDAAKTDDSVDFIISVNHRPIQAEQYIGDISAWVRNEIVPILSETPKHVLNYGGHHHLYHRGQLPNYPLYHIINGGASWDQMWGMSSEKDYDDVQKTIDYWTYQIVEFDYETKKMSVECYAIGNKDLVVDNILIDKFERQLDCPKPNKPTLNGIPSTVTLPLTAVASPYETTSKSDLNTVQFQVSTNSAFSSFAVNSIVDVENLYGSTKSPLYLPIDINEDKDIRSISLSKGSLKNGIHYIRVRYRDANMEWSEWSDVQSFEVAGSIDGDPAISVPKTNYDLGENIVVDYEFAPEGEGAWIGIYRKGDRPGTGIGTIVSQIWKATPNAAGKLTIGNLNKVNEYYIAFFKDGGYTEAAPRITIYVGPIPTVTSEKTNYEEAETISINYTDAPGLSNDWIGIYRVGMTPGPVASLKWAYTPSGSKSGTMTLSNSLPKGYYFASYLLLGAYYEPGERCYFSIGEKISTIQSAKTDYAPSEDITISYQNGPGTPKDWIGVYEEGKEVDIDELNGFFYTYGETDGTIVIGAGEIPAGEYFISFFINDSYDEVSERIHLTIGKAPALAVAIQDNKLQISFNDIPEWRNAINEIEINESVVDASEVSVEEGMITLDAKYVTTDMNRLNIRSTGWMDASIEFDDIITSIRSNRNSAFAIYPNPVLSNLYIDNPGNEFHQFELLSLVGELIQKGRLHEGKNSIDLCSVPNGSYIISLSGNKERQTVLVIKK